MLFQSPYNGWSSGRRCAFAQQLEEYASISPLRNGDLVVADSPCAASILSRMRLKALAKLQHQRHLLSSKYPVRRKITISGIKIYCRNLAVVAIILYCRPLPPALKKWIECIPASDLSLGRRQTAAVLLRSNYLEKWLIKQRLNWPRSCWSTNFHGPS